MIVEIVLLGLLLWLLYYLYQRPRKLDLPGPKGLPILGNLLQLDPKYPHLKVTEWGKKYGGVYTIRLLSENWVIISDYDLMHKVYVTEGMDYAGRPDIYRWKYYSFDRSDIFMAEPRHHSWHALRKTTQRGLKQYSSGMKNIEDTLNVMAAKFMDQQARYEGKPHNPTDDIYDYTLSVLIVFVLGSTFAEDRELINMVKRMERTVVLGLATTGRGTELDMFPWLRFFGNWAYSMLTESRNLSLAVWQKVKPVLLQDLDMSNPSCVVDSLLVALNSDPKLEDKNIRMVMFNMFVAGMTTTSHTIMALFGVLVHYPEVMRRLQEEVDEVVGSGRSVTLEDRDSMPYTRATIHELLRYSTIVPLGVPHANVIDKELGGAHIPKGTTVILNSWQLHHDEKFWDEPYKFMPERFLDERGGVLPPDHPNRQHLLPFGAGTRVCVGEILALARLFMFAATLMQRFDILPHPDKKPPSCDSRTYDIGIALCPKIGEIRMVPRV